MQRIVVTVSDDGAPRDQRRFWNVSITYSHADGGKTQIGEEPIIMRAIRLDLDLGGGRKRTVTVPHPGELGDDALTALLTRRALNEFKHGNGVAYGRWLHRRCSDPCGRRSRRLPTGRDWSSR